MHKTDTLILLVNSLTKTEKRSFNSYSRDSDYLTLFNIIEKDKGITKERLKELFLEKRPDASFEIAASYLYKLLLDTLLTLRENQDHHYTLLNKLLKARILFEKCLFEEGLNMLEQVKNGAEKHENDLAYLYASLLEMSHLMVLDFPNISEKELLSKQYKIGEKIKTIRLICEHSSLSELMKHRIIYQERVRSHEQKNRFNDLIFSEISIMNSSNINRFEIQKQHQLFQSNYLLHVSDYESALNSFYELNNLFEKNSHLWTDPPVYYVMVLEGILHNLRSIGKYSEMSYFIERLRTLMIYSSVYFQAEVSTLIFMYELFPLLDKGNFKDAAILIEKQKSLEKIHFLNLSKQAEIYLYQALVYLGNKNWKKASRTLSQIIICGKSFYSLPLYRTIRLINLMICYKIRDFDRISYETRSIKSEVSKNEKTYKTEELVLRFLNLPHIATHARRKKIEQKILSELEELRSDNFERQILILFDFTAFIESELRNIPLSTVLSEKFTE